MSTDRARVNELMRLAALGQEDAFGHLAGETQDELFRVALAQGLLREDAAEVVQETLLRAYKGRRGWDPRRDVLAWLWGIEMNVVRRLRRERRRRREEVALDWVSARLANATVEGNALDLMDLAETLQRLPARQREAIGCRYLRQMSVRDTAAAMGCAEGTVKAAVFAAIENLRDMLRAQT